MARTVRTPTITAYQDVSGRWRWRLRAANGRIAATSGEDFASRYNACRAARRLLAIARHATFRFPPA